MIMHEPSNIKCPHCEADFPVHDKPFFVHIYGFTEWSDGETFNELPSIKTSDLQRCDSCKGFFIYSTKMGGLSVADCLDAITYFKEEYKKSASHDSSSEEKEKIKFNYQQRIRSLRIQILRGYNNSIRKHPLNNFSEEPLPFSEPDRIIFLQSAKALLDLLLELDSTDYLLRAELNRNLGLFEDAQAEVNKLSNEKVKAILLKEINTKNRDVVVIDSPVLRGEAT